MPCIPDLSVGDSVTKPLLFFFKHLQAVLSLPLKWGKRFRYKAGNRNCHLRLTRFFCSRKAVIKLYHILCKLGYTFDILLGFGRQTIHKIQLYLIFPSLKRCPARAHKIIALDVFVYYIAHPLSTGFRSKCYPTCAYAWNLFHKLLCKAVYTKRRKRYTDILILRPG